MSNPTKINDIVHFVSKHPQSVASRRICREILGEALERFNAEFAAELTAGLQYQDETQINSYYDLIR